MGHRGTSNESRMKVYESTDRHNYDPTLSDLPHSKFVTNDVSNNQMLVSMI